MDPEKNESSAVVALWFTGVILVLTIIGLVMYIQGPTDSEQPTPGYYGYSGQGVE